MEYQKINTVFKRDEKNNIMPEFVTDELKMFAELGMKFDATEKIDGTNMRVEIDFKNVGTEDQPEMVTNLYYGGRTANASIPTFLLAKMMDIFDKVDWTSIFPSIQKDTTVTIHGEGYGAKIQKGGGRYISNGVDFILFDVRVGDWFLDRASLEDIAGKLGIKIVPFIGQFTVAEAIEFVRKGFTSRIAEDETLIAEGLVLRAPFGLKFRNGERIAYKVKYKDFEKYLDSYGREFDITL